MQRTPTERLPPWRLDGERRRGRVLFLLAVRNGLHQTPEGRRNSAWAIGGDPAIYATQWNNPALRLPEAHAVPTGNGVTMDVLDTGSPWR